MQTVGKRGHPGERTYNGMRGGDRHSGSRSNGDPSGCSEDRCQGCSKCGGSPTSEQALTKCLDHGVGQYGTRKSTQTGANSAPQDGTTIVGQAAPNERGNS